MATRRLACAIGAAVGLWLCGPTPALAQYTKQTTCVGKQTLPRFDKHYIKKYCGPTICPGSCFGFFPTKWTRWEDACPGGDCGDPTAVGYYGPVPNAPGIVSAAPGTAAPAPAQTPAAPVETAPEPKPASPSKPLPLPLPNSQPEKSGTPLPQPQPDKPRTEASAAPVRTAPPVSTGLESRVPELNLQYPVSVPVQPVVQPPVGR